jgi:GrpB-like predicted nucleotidyltransferase (UPF0157 family)
MENIRLEPHNKCWADEFHKEGRLIANTLGDVIFSVHHVGSTAVADLIAKPIIDIAIESFAYPPSTHVVAKLNSIGYEHKGESGVSGRSWFIKGIPRKYHIHFCPVNSLIIINQIKFRDLLIADASLRKAYEQIKITNSIGRDIDSSDYAAAKSELISFALA